MTSLSETALERVTGAGGGPLTKVETFLGTFNSQKPLSPMSIHSMNRIGNRVQAAAFLAAGVASYVGLSSKLNDLLSARTARAAAPANK